MQETDLLRVYINENWILGLEISPTIVLLLAAVCLIAFCGLRWWRHHRRRLQLVQLDISLGGIGQVQLRPVIEDIQIAHRIWTELVTRKVALPIDLDHDVIVEVYNSWYSLFGKVRDLIASIPAHVIREEKSTQELIRIATATLNQGLRPHLTRWQARFRNWYTNQAEMLMTKTPQEVQKEFPEYSTLKADMQRVNEQMIQYAAQLQKLIRES